MAVQGIDPNAAGMGDGLGAFQNVIEMAAQKAGSAEGSLLADGNISSADVQAIQQAIQNDPTLKAAFEQASAEAGGSDLEALSALGLQTDENGNFIDENGNQVATPQEVARDLNALYFGDTKKPGSEEASGGESQGGEKPGGEKPESAGGSEQSGGGEQAAKAQEDFLNKLVELADTNGDGVISPEELKTFLSKYDENGDGKLDAQELTKLGEDLGNPELAKNLVAQLGGSEQELDLAGIEDKAKELDTNAGTGLDTTELAKLVEEPSSMDQAA